MNKIILFILISFSFFKAKAQEPSWFVDSSTYQFSMNFTAFLNVDGRTLSSSEDKVAVFVGDEIRGVSNLVYVANYDKYVAFITVYANTTSEVLSFKIYDSTNDTTVEVSSTENFEINGSLGGVFQSYSIASPVLSNLANLSTFSFLGITNVSETIIDNTINIVLPANTDITNLSPSFNISEGTRVFVNGEEQTSGVSIQDFTNTVTYSFLSENEAVLFDYQITISTEIVSVNPPEIQLETTENTFVNEAPVLINLKTSVPIWSIDKSNLLLTNAVVSSIEKESELSYNIQIVPIQQGEFSIEILENEVFNLDDEGNIASNKLSFTYDLISPYVVSIKRKTPLDEITTGDTLIFEVIFSEAIENITESDFNSIIDATYTLETTDNFIYAVSIKNIDTFYGVVGLNINDTNSIQDKAGNLLINSVFKAHKN